MSNYSDPAHTDRPNLEQKRKLAKDLLKAVKRLDGGGAARFIWNHPRFRGKTGQDVIREGVTLVEAQHVIARESGFDSWPKLKEYIRLLEVEPDGPVAAFEDAVHATIRGDAKRLKALLHAHPEIATMRSTRRHRCVLPHYIAANGVENEHQVAPTNAPEIARILFDAGAATVVDATAEIYGSGPGSTPLVALVSSTHPHEVGVQAELVHIFCEAGASVNGVEDDGLPIHVALGFRYPQAASALAECGARIDNLPTAAGLGRLDLVEAYLDESSQLVSNACHFPNPKHDRFPRSVAPHPSATLQQALVFACMSGRTAIAKLLLDHGVEVNGGPRRGITALHEACYQGQAEAAHLLLQHGADPTIRDRMWDSTAIGWADGGKQSNLIEWLFELSKVDILDAVELNRFGMVRRLLEANPSLANAPKGKGAALRYAAFKNNLKMAKLLLEFDADPTLRNENGHSALDYAEKSNDQEMIQLLTAAAQRKSGQ
ncbi:MAG: ankyrin repeat domain-containing protein [Planctomycetales bacterium]|nr:ankyrin repeat domain-containing protein [Planctomycetales bacterium]